jgi:hypothetical protein
VLAATVLLPLLDSLPEDEAPEIDD